MKSTKSDTVCNALVVAQYHSHLFADESTRWRRVVFGRPGVVSIRLMNDSVRVLPATVDTLQHRVTLSSRADTRITHVMAYATLAIDGLPDHPLARGRTATSVPVRPPPAIVGPTALAVDRRVPVHGQLLTDT
jgi:hypothetical protein